MVVDFIVFSVSFCVVFFNFFLCLFLFKLFFDEYEDDVRFGDDVF